MTAFNRTLETAYVDSELASREDVPFVDIRPPWAWSVAVGAAAVSVALAVFLFFGRVESVARVRGMVLPASGMSVMSSERGGIARRILVTPGQHVRAGDPLVAVQSSDINASHTAAIENLRFAREQAVRAAEAEDAAFAREIAEVTQRRALLAQQAASLERTRQLAKSQVEANKHMEASGLISRSQANRDEAELEHATRLVIANREALAALAGELNARRLRHSQVSMQREREIARSLADVRTAESRVDDEIVRAATAGVVDTIVVRHGEIVRGGQMLLRVVPRTDDLRVIGYVPEVHRQRVGVGTEAVISLDQFNDSRRFRGRIARIADFPAGRDELVTTVGWAVPVDYAGYRIEVVVEGVDARMLRAGMLADINVRLGHVRPITLLLGTKRQPLPDSAAAQP